MRDVPHPRACMPPRRRLPAAARLAVALLAVALLATAGCRGREDVPPGPPTFAGLAAAWSGRRADPTCQPQGPRGEYLGGIAGAEYCQWPTVVRGRQSGTVRGHRSAGGGLALLTWERALAEPAAVDGFADSRGTALGRARGSPPPSPVPAARAGGRRRG